jgi:hypothetical protein
MDPLSITASIIIACIRIVDRVISMRKDYVATVRDVPSDLRIIEIEDRSIRWVLEICCCCVGVGVIRRGFEAFPPCHHHNRVLSKDVTRKPLIGCIKAAPDLLEVGADL